MGGQLVIDVGELVLRDRVPKKVPTRLFLLEPHHGRAKAAASVEDLGVSRGLRGGGLVQCRAPLAKSEFVQRVPDNPTGRGEVAGGGWGDRLSYVYQWVVMVAGGKKLELFRLEG